MATKRKTALELIKAVCSATFPEKALPYAKKGRKSVELEFVPQEKSMPSMYERGILTWGVSRGKGFCWSNKKERLLSKGPF